MSCVVTVLGPRADDNTRIVDMVNEPCVACMCRYVRVGVVSVLESELRASERRAVGGPRETERRRETRVHGYGRRRRVGRLAGEGMLKVSTQSFCPHLVCQTLTYSPTAPCSSGQSFMMSRTISCMTYSKIRISTRWTTDIFCCAATVSFSVWSNTCG